MGSSTINRRAEAVKAAAGSAKGSRRPDSRQSLCEAALKLFDSRGFPGATVQEIVEAANVSKGSFYHWFDSKDDVLRLIHDEFIDDMLERVAAVIDDGGPSDQVVARLIEELFNSVEAHLPSVRVFVRDYRFLSADALAAASVKRDQLADLLAKALEAGLASGEFREIESPRIMAFGVFGMCAWAVEWFDSSGPLSGREIARMYADVLLRGLQRPPDKQEQAAT